MRGDESRTIRFVLGDDSLHPCWPHDFDEERYRSGQPGQTVNLLAYAYGGSNPPLSTILQKQTRRLRSIESVTGRVSVKNTEAEITGGPRSGITNQGNSLRATKLRPFNGRDKKSHAGIAQMARARAFQARGRGFEPRFPLQ